MAERIGRHKTTVRRVRITENPAASQRIFPTKRLRSSKCLAPNRWATSEDTTLPILMRGSSEEVAVYAVINGVLTSAAVPVLIRAVAALSGAGG